MGILSVAQRPGTFNNKEIWIIMPAKLMLFRLKHFVSLFELTIFYVLFLLNFGRFTTCLNVFFFHSVED